MLREQQIMKEIVETMGDSLDSYISTFNDCDLWYYTENELMVNKTLKELLTIISKYYLTTAEEELKNAFRFVNSDKRYMIPMLSYLGDLHLKNGSESVLNRTIIFCFALSEICKAEGKLASEILEVVYTYDLAQTKENWWTRFKHKIGYYKHPYKLNVNSDGLMLVALISGKSLEDAFEYMLLSYNLE